MGDDESLEVGGLVRRVRRTLDLSQRGLARRVGIAKTAIGRAECGDDLSVGQLQAILKLAGLRLLVVDDAGEDVIPMRPDAVRDNAGRRYPAHLDARWPRRPVSHWDYGRSRTRPLPVLIFEQRTRRDWLHPGEQRPQDHPSAADKPVREPRSRVARPAQKPWYEEPCGCVDDCIELCVQECTCQCQPPDEFLSFTG